MPRATRYVISRPLAVDMYTLLLRMSQPTQESLPLQLAQGPISGHRRHVRGGESVR